MFTTSLFRLQANNPSTFAVLMNKRQRSRVARYLSDLEASGLHRLDDKMYEKLINKLQKGHMSYDNNELSIMRAAITLNRFGMPLSYICKKYIAYSVARSGVRAA